MFLLGLELNKNHGKTRVGLNSTRSTLIGKFYGNIFVLRRTRHFKSEYLTYLIQTPRFHPLL